MKVFLSNCFYVAGHPDHPGELNRGRLIATDDRVYFEIMNVEGMAPRWVEQFTIPMDAIQTVSCGLERYPRRPRELRSRRLWAFIELIIWSPWKLFRLPDPNERLPQVRLTIAATINEAEARVQFAPDAAWHENSETPEVPPDMHQWAKEVNLWIRRVRRRPPAAE